jgi:hypothetical protein
MDDSRVRGDSQGQSDAPSIPPLEQAGIDDDKNIGGRKRLLIAPEIRMSSEIRMRSKENWT